MGFEQAILIWCVAAPALTIVAATLLALWCGGRCAAMLVSIGWWAAILLALSNRQGWEAWPADAWRMAIWPLLGWSIFAGLTPKIGLLTDSACEPQSSSGIDWHSSRWIVAGVLACLTAFVAMPSGEQWSDTFKLHRYWMAGVASSCLINSYALDWMSRNGAARWSLLVALSALGGAMALAASTFASLGEWTLAMLVVTSVVSLLVAFSPRASAANLWAVSFPVLAAATGVVAASRFYTYEDHPIWVYLILLYQPAVVATADWMIQSRSAWIRVLVSGCLSAAMIAVAAWGVMAGG